MGTIFDDMVAQPTPTPAPAPAANPAPSPAPAPAPTIFHEMAQQQSAPAPAPTIFHEMAQQNAAPATAAPQPTLPQPSIFHEQLAGRKAAEEIARAPGLSEAGKKAIIQKHIKAVMGPIAQPTPPPEATAAQPALGTNRVVKENLTAQPSGQTLNLPLPIPAPIPGVSVPVPIHMAPLGPANSSEAQAARFAIANNLPHTSSVTGLPINPVLSLELEARKEQETNQRVTQVVAHQQRRVASDQRITQYIDSIPGIPSASPEEQNPMAVAQRQFLREKPIPWESFADLPPHWAAEHYRNLVNKLKPQLPTIGWSESLAQGVERGKGDIASQGAGATSILNQLPAIDTAGGEGGYAGEQQSIKNLKDWRNRPNRASTDPWIEEMRRYAQGKHEQNDLPPASAAGAAAGKIAETATTLAPAVAAGAIGGPAGSAAMFAAQGAGGQYESARQWMIANNIDPDTQQGKLVAEALIKGGIDAALALIPGHPTGVKAFAKSGAVLAGMEAGRQVVSHVGHGEKYDPTAVAKAFGEGLIFHAMSKASEALSHPVRSAREAAAAVKEGTEKLRNFASNKLPQNVEQGRHQPAPEQTVINGKIAQVQRADEPRQAPKGPPPPGVRRVEPEQAAETQQKPLTFWDHYPPPGSTIEDSTLVTKDNKPYMLAKDKEGNSYYFPALEKNEIGEVHGVQAPVQSGGEEPKKPTPPGFGRREIEDALIDHHRQMGGVADAADEAELEKAASGNAFTFADRIPEEVSTYLEGRPQLRKFVKAAKAGEPEYANAGGLDALKELGEDRYFEQIERKANGGYGRKSMERAVDEAAGSGDPQTQLKAAYYRTMLPPKERVSQIGTKPADIPTWSEFEINKLPVQVVENEEGIRVLKGKEFGELPLDHLESVPVDHGSMRDMPEPEAPHEPINPAEAKEPQFRGEGLETTPATGKPAQNIPKNMPSAQQMPARSSKTVYWRDNHGNVVQGTIEARAQGMVAARDQNGKLHQVPIDRLRKTPTSFQEQRPQRVPSLEEVQNVKGAHYSKPVEEPGRVPHPVYTTDELRRMPGAKLKQAAEEWGVTFDSRSTTIPRVLDAQARWRLGQMSDSDLYNAVKDAGLRAGTRQKNIETLAHQPAQQPQQPKTIFHEMAEKQKLAQLKPQYQTHGWKLHLATDDPEVVSAYLKEHGIPHKVGRNSGQEGKDVTVYVGDRRLAEQTAKDIEANVGERLKAPVGDALTDDRQFTPKVMGRFEVSSKAPEFHQYGTKGIPFLNEDMQAKHFDAQNFNEAEALKRSHEALAKKFGDFYEPRAQAETRDSMGEDEFQRRVLEETQKELEKGQSDAGGITKTTGVGEKLSGEESAGQGRPIVFDPKQIQPFNQPATAAPGGTPSNSYAKKLEDRRATYAQQAKEASIEELSRLLESLPDTSNHPADGIDRMRREAVESELSRRNTQPKGVPHEGQQTVSPRPEGQVPHEVQGQKAAQAQEQPAPGLPEHDAGAAADVGQAAPPWDHSRETAQKAFVQFKRRLARAESSGDPRKVLAEVEAFDKYYQRPGSEPYPDDWARWQRAKDDANFKIQREHLSDSIRLATPAAPKPTAPSRISRARNKVAELNKSIGSDLDKLKADFDAYFKPSGPGGSQLPSTTGGVDPKLLQMVVKGLSLYTKKGVVKFADAVLALAEAMPEHIDKLHDALSAAWRVMKKYDDRLDDPGNVADHLREGRKKVEEKPQKTEAAARDFGTIDAPNRSALGDHFAEQLAAGKKYDTIHHARDEASELLGDQVKPGTIAAKHVDEAVEIGVTKAARQIIADNADDAHTAYEKLQDLYSRQPNLAVRTSESMQQQAYSTPAPLAFIAQKLAGIDENTKVYEPTAGNGMLITGADPQNVFANELNPDRAAALADQGFDATQKDATTHLPAEKVDAVIANPPFGTIKSEGKNKTWDAFGKPTEQIDHAIAAKSLQAMKDDGRAVLILGAKGHDAETSLDVRKAYLGRGVRDFYKSLYDKYNITDHFTVSGDLYKRQGAGFPVDVIVIDGRRNNAAKLERDYPWAQAPSVYNSWQELGHVLDNVRDSTGQMGEGVEPTPVPLSGSGSGSPPSGGDVTDVGSVPAAPGRPNRPADQSGGAAPSAPDDRTGVGKPSGPLPKPPIKKPQSGPRSGELGGRGESSAPVSPPQSSAVPGAGQGNQPGHGGASGHQPAVVAGPAAPRRVIKQDEATEFQVPYKPASASNGLGTLIPKNMADSASRALEAVEKSRGNLDEFVAKELGLRPHELSARYGAEQIDALALAIHNHKNGAAFIDGDQTGVGKGRVMAGMIQYAKQQDLLPIFVTAGPNLYADLMRDLADTGSHSLARPFNPLVTNYLAGDKRVPLPDGRALETTSDHKNVFLTAVRNYLDGKGLTAAVRGRPVKFDAIFTNYSQLQTVKGEATFRHQALRDLRRRALFLLDESHEAGGTREGGWKPSDQPAVGGRAGFVRDLIKEAPGVIYSSATYAKRPEVMDLYGRTDMRLAVENNLDRLPAAIAKGGVPLQQAVANMLSEAGQYVRRERTFKGVNFAPEVLDIGLEKADKTSEIFRAIRDFDQIKEAAVEAFTDDHVAGGGTINADNATGDTGIKSTNFTSIVWNLVDQMLLTLKTDRIAQKAIEAHKSGQRPIIAIDNTMEGALKRYIDEKALKKGDPIDMNFKTLLQHYLDRSRTLSIKDFDGTTTHHYLTDEELGPEGVKLYNQTKKLIEKSGLDLPSSPIDRLHYLLRKEGLKTAEITGRKHIIDYQDDGSAILSHRESDDIGTKGRVNSVKGFNNGDVDALIINRAGSTGLSLHSHPSYGNTDKRHMIIGQPAKNIDTFMQMLGRVHRTGQIVPPDYTLLLSNAPAENRPSSVLIKKLASLNANVTADRTGAVNFDQVPDVMNSVGDGVVADYMLENEELHKMLGEPLPRNDSGHGLNPQNAAAKVSGRAALLPVKDQQSFWHDVVERYNAKIKELDAIGENPLVAKTLDLDADTLKTLPLFKGDPKSTSPFAGPAQLEEVDMKKVGKPYPAEEVSKQLRDLLKVERDGQIPQVGKEWASRSADELEIATQAYKKERLKSAANADTAAKIERDIDANLAAVRNTMTTLSPGTPVTLTTPRGEDYEGVVTGYIQRGKPKNPSAAGSWAMRVAVADAARQVDVPLSAMNSFRGGDGGYNVFNNCKRLTDALPEFDHALSKSRESRFIATGNLLAAYDKVQNGQIIHYSKKDGSQATGILLPKKFDLTTFLDRDPVKFDKPENVSKFLQRGHFVSSEDQGLKVFMGRGGRELTLEAPKSKQAGGQYTMNEKLLRAASPDQFVSAGNKMRLSIEDEAQANRVLKTAMNEFGLYAHKEKETARVIMGLPSLTEQAGQLKAPAPAKRPPNSRSGMAYIPDIPGAAKNALAEVRHLRERNSIIEAKDGPEMASALTLNHQADAQSQSMIRAFVTRNFKKDKATLQDFLALGHEYRGEIFDKQNMPATGVPRLSDAEQKRIEANPKIQAAIADWNRQIAPMLQDIRARNNLPMSKAASTVPLFLNLPTEYDPASAARADANLGKAFNLPASGEGSYLGDPQEALSAILRGHLRTDAAGKLIKAVRNISIDKNSVKDPSGTRNPAQFEAAKDGEHFEAIYKGRTEKVEAIDLNADKFGQPKWITDEDGNKVPYWPPELHYVPKRVADAIKNFRQSTDPTDTLADKVMHGLTRASLIGDFAPHSLRMLLTAGSRMGQSGQSILAGVKWIGSIPAALIRMRQMTKTPMGETMQMLVDRTGSNRGGGYNLHEPKTKVGKVLDAPHKALMGSEAGMDPMIRRLTADTFLRLEHGNRFMDSVEADLKAAKITPYEASSLLQKKIGAEGMQKLARFVNGTLGFSNRQSRSNLINWAQRVAPFLSSQSGMIPNELRWLLTLNLHPESIIKNARRGEWKTAAVQLATQIGSGPIGTYLMMQALNYATTKLQNGQGRFMEDNDEGHKLDVQIAPGWYVSNLDPMLSRSTRLLGIRARANKKPQTAGEEIGRESMNEIAATLNPALRMGFTAATGDIPYIVQNQKLMAARTGWWWPAGFGRNTIEGATSDRQGGAARGLLKDTASLLAGLRLSESNGANYSDAERLAHQILQKDISGREMTPEAKAKRDQRRALVESLRQNPHQKGLITNAIEQGVIPRSEIKEVQKEAQQPKLVTLLKTMEPREAADVYEKASTAEKDQIREAVLNKIIRSQSDSAARQDELLSKLGISAPPDLNLARELHALNQKEEALSEAKQKARSLFRQATQQAAPQAAEYLRREAQDLLKANFLKPQEAGRRIQLMHIHTAISKTRQRMEDGTMKKQEGEAQIKKLVGLAAARKAA